MSGQLMGVQLLHKECHDALKQQEALQRASIAWRDLKHSEAEIVRLRAYKAMTAGMKDDYRKAVVTASESRKVLDDVLKVRP